MDKVFVYDAEAMVEELTVDNRNHGFACAWYPRQYPGTRHL